MTQSWLLPTPHTFPSLYVATGLIYMSTWVLYEEGSRIAPFLAASVPAALAVQVSSEQAERECRVGHCNDEQQGAHSGSPGRAGQQ